MNCIFCHKDSSTSKSEEHIIPESLGNKLHVLPKGYVCDECNAKKIEKVLLEQSYFVSARFRNEILTKKNKPMEQLEIALSLFYKKYNLHRIHASIAYLSPMNFWKCWEYGWIETVVNQIRKTVKFKLKIPYQEVLKRIENHENTDNLNDLKTEKLKIVITLLSN